MTNRRETTHASSLYPARRRGCRQSGFIGKRFTQLNSQVIEQFEQRPTAFANGASPSRTPYQNCCSTFCPHGRIR
ncbi:hypothetical protein COLINT_03158 [Collinsella intestinalis DSM 13280]|uniref:Uncharacterized protein n=1 Tax=Collinsella intestinalis DSM 13280 TaxID=521003 RepID=C4FAR3_9ACTN|nr:hypothetical protein COLINT_03158 [Collinsella intestinalis DSM 13280]